MAIPYLYSFMPLRGAVRSSKWPAFRAAWLKDHPKCCACGRGDELEVHHKIPVHVQPSLELDESNVMTLCARSNWFCHYLIGHNGTSWQDYRRDPEAAAATALQALRTI